MQYHSKIYFVSDIAIFVLKRDVKLQPTNQPTNQLKDIMFALLLNILLVKYSVYDVKLRH